MPQITGPQHITKAGASFFAENLYNVTGNIIGFVAFQIELC